MISDVRTIPPVSDVEIEVKLYASLRRYRPDSAGGALHHPFAVSLPSDATLASLIAQLNIPDGLVAAASRNDEAVELGERLCEGDMVDLFPPVAGG